MLASQPKLHHSDASPNKVVRLSDAGDGIDFAKQFNHKQITFIFTLFCCLNRNWKIVSHVKQYHSRNTHTHTLRMSSSKFHGNSIIRIVHSCVFAGKKTKQHRIELIKTSIPFTIFFLYSQHEGVQKKCQIPIVFATKKCGLNIWNTEKPSLAQWPYLITFGTIVFGVLHHFNANSKSSLIAERIHNIWLLVDSTHLFAVSLSLSLSLCVYFIHAEIHVFLEFKWQTDFTIFIHSIRTIHSIGLLF